MAGRRFIGLWAAVSLAAALTLGAAEAPQAKAAPAPGSVRVMVDLAEQLDLAPLARRWSDQGRSRASRPRLLVKALGRVARRGQKRIEPLLRSLKQQGLVDSWDGLTIVNRVVVRGRRGMIAHLASHPEVVAVHEEVTAEALLERFPASPGERLEGEFLSWALPAIGAPAAWEKGLDGEGVVVGVMDTGASAGHEQLGESFRNGGRSWFDPHRHSPMPTDVQIGHGTATLSCAVGGNPAGRAVGVAPRARWIAAVAIAHDHYGNIWASLAADWMLRVGRPDVLIVAWRLPGEGCDRSLERIVNVWRAAGIVVVYAAGNDGPRDSSDVSPANYAGLIPDGRPAFSVGAVGPGKRIYEGSSRGPGRCGGDVFPRLVAPGEDVPVALPLQESLYRSASGTSYAAAFVAGAAALLLQRHPDASVEEVEDAILAGAQDLGEEGPDPIFGYGLLDIPRALADLSERVARRRE